MQGGEIPGSQCEFLRTRPPLDLAFTTGGRDAVRVFFRADDFTDAENACRAASFAMRMFGKTPERRTGMPDIQAAVIHLEDVDVEDHGSGSSDRDSVWRLSDLP